MNEANLRQLFEQFNHQKVLVIGDVMIDAYLWGTVNRISPEAPVPIVDVTKRENRLGGAANVAKNIKALGAKPFLCSVIGDDEKACILHDLLVEQDLNTDGILTSKNRITTTKFRIIGNHSQLLRVDEEITNNINEIDTHRFLEKVNFIIQKEKIDVIIFEDYDKGLLTANTISTIVSMARDKNIPVIVDPKKRNFLAYQNTSLFKPNLKEIKEGLNIDFMPHDEGALRDAIMQIHDQMNIDIVMTTLSEKGICISQKSKQLFSIISAHQRDIVDVSGAGDTVISVASLCLACNLDAETLTILSNLAGGIVCEKAGVANIEKERLLQEAIKLAI